MQELQSIFQKHKGEFFPIVALGEGDKVASLNLSVSNNNFSPEIFNDLELFSAWINEQRTNERARYLIGGYNEHRAMYRRSKLFDGVDDLNDEPRSLHLAMDLWADSGTEVFAPLDGIVHSFAFNNKLGDYGATIILQHQIESIKFYTLYGHLSLKDIQGFQKEKKVSKGEVFAHFGPPGENGNWPPHLHLQVIADIGNHEGDYPGVCKPSEAAQYLANCPDPSMIFQPFG